MKINRILMLLAALLVLLGTTAKVQAATTYTFTGNTSGAWNVDNNWSPSTGFPIAGDTAIIPTGKSCIGLGGANEACATLTIQGSGTLTVDANTLTVSGVTTVGSSGGTGATLTVASGATFTSTSTSGGSYGFAGTTPSIVNNGIFNCAGGAGYSTGSIQNNGTMTFTGSQQAFNGTIAVTQGANGTLNLNSSSSTPFGGNCTLSATATGNTVLYAAGQNAYGTTYYNLTFTGASPSAGSGTHVTGTLTAALNSGAQINSAGNITFASGANIIRTSGAFSGTPTFGGPVNLTYNGASAITTGSELPTSSTALKNLTITDTAGVTLNANATVNGTFSATYVPGTPALASGSHTLAFENSPVNIAVSGNALSAGDAYTIVSSSGTTVSGSLGVVTVTGPGAPYSSGPTASTITGQLVLTVPSCTSMTAAPVVFSPVCAGSTSISGTSASGASILVYDFTSSTQIGTATASGTSWTAAVTAVTAGHSIAATAQTAGTCVSPASIAVTVQSGTLAPSINSPICAGSTSISGTSASGASIVVYDLTSSTQIGTATASGTSWTAAVTGAVAGDSIAATAQTVATCVSPASTAVTVQSVTTAPVITSPIYAGSTSISGTSVSGASIVVYDLASSTQIGTAMAGGTSWTAAVTAAVAGDSIAATAQTAGDCVSPASIAVTVQSVATTNTLSLLTVANTNINAGTFLTITNVALTNGVPAN